jgi:hypothetical protein
LPVSKPVAPDAKFGRVDQGVDYSQKGPYRAVGPGVVTRIAPHSVQGGTGIGLYYRLDHPITVNGRTYQELYIWHTSPLVNVGDRVKAGTPLMSGGSAELGFAQNSAPVAPLVGGFGAKTQPTSAGKDFLAFAKKGAAHTPDYSLGNLTGTAAANQTSAPLASSVVPPPSVVPPTAPQAVGVDVQLPGSVAYTITPHQQAAQLWEQAASGDFVSPETQQLLANAKIVGG